MLAKIFWFTWIVLPAAGIDFQPQTLRSLYIVPKKGRIFKM